MVTLNIDFPENGLARAYLARVMGLANLKGYSRRRACISVGDADARCAVVTAKDFHGILDPASESSLTERREEVMCYEETDHPHEA